MIDEGPALMAGMRPNEELWAFVYKLFKSGQIESWCLEWQHSYGLDISFLLWAGWLQHVRNQALSEQHVRRALLTIEEWRQRVVAPVRAARHYLERTGYKNSDPASYAEIRAHLRAAELCGERREQELLVAYAENVTLETMGSTGRSSNMRMVLEHLAGVLSTRHRRRIAEMDRVASGLAATVVER